jgi:proteasome accessory factor B
VTGVAGPDELSGWDRVEVLRATQGLADEVLSHGPDVVLLEPAAIRDQVVERLTRVAG